MKIYIKQLETERGEIVLGIGVGILIYLIPIILVAFVIRWIRLIMLNSEEQVQQNKEIITLLTELKEKKN